MRQTGLSPLPDMISIRGKPLADEIPVVHESKSDPVQTEHERDMGPDNQPYFGEIIPEIDFSDPSTKFLMLVLAVFLLLMLLAIQK